MYQESSTQSQSALNERNFPALGQVLSRRFVVIRELGAGGGGEVWLAQDRERNEIVAVKMLSITSSAAWAAIEDIAARLADIDDPNILRIRGCFRSEDCAWLVMDYAAGGDLTALRGRPSAVVLHAVIPVARALARLHRAGIVHRDVKPANVVLMADGTPRLADFGTAMLIEQTPGTALAAGSPYTVSPESLEGCPATPADDVYAFGTMLYELLSGYPPFYPDINAARVRSEAAPPIVARSPVPEELRELVAWCLRKAPGERPASMELVEARLQRVLNQLSASIRADASVEQSMATNETGPDTPERTGEPRAAAPGAAAPGAAAPLIRPPAMPAEPLRSEWRRTTSTAPDPAEFRKQGFRRGLTVSAIALAAIAIFVVFFALPKWVGNDQPSQYRQAASPVVDTKPAEAPKKPVDFAELARAKQQAEEVREPLFERLEKLRERGVEQWAADEYKKASDELAAGDAKFAEREYVVAVQHFEKIEPMVIALEARGGEVLKQQLAAGALAISEGRSADAKAAYELALKLQPKNGVATRGLERAGSLDQVLALLSAAERKEQDGDITAAMNDYRQALALDKDATRASDGLTRLSSRVAGDAFASSMARGFADLGTGNFVAARTAFESAGKIRPNAPEVAAALKQVEQDERTQSIAGKLEVARDNESKELWSEALKQFRDVLALDSTVAAANEGVARVQPRATLNEQLEVYLTQPERLFSAPVRSAARETLQRASAIQNPGPVLTRQLATLRDWIARSDVPVQVALQSDNVTQVTIHRIGSLGAFEQRSLELAPGEYTALGTRPGYRDVRRQFMVAPGNVLAPIVIRCEDKI